MSTPHSPTIVVLAVVCGVELIVDPCVVLVVVCVGLGVLGVVLVVLGVVMKVVGVVIAVLGVVLVVGEGLQCIRLGQLHTGP